MVLDVDFMTLNILKLEFFHIPWFYYELEGTITNSKRKLMLYNFIMILANSRQLRVQYIYLHTTCTIF